MPDGFGPVKKVVFDPDGSVVVEYAKVLARVGIAEVRGTLEINELTLSSPDGSTVVTADLLRRVPSEN